ncbi:MAG: hypothetical protein RL262_963 [Bacteroidota bacterium]
MILLIYSASKLVIIERNDLFLLLTIFLPILLVKNYLSSAAAILALGFFKNSFLHSVEQNPKTSFS